ncbi:MAG: hypothetical protein ACIWVG_03130 [Gloeotrichia echinulata HAB0833]
MTLPAGIRKVYNYFYKKKSLGGSSVPTPTQIKEYFESRGFDLDSITDEQFNQAINHFSSCELSIIQQDDDNDGVGVSVSEKEASRREAVATLLPNGDAKSEQACDVEKPNKLAITPTSKSELVSSAAQSLGIVLNTQEISEIANNVKSSSEELDDSLDEIKSAIVAFIKYKASLNSQKISQIVKDINQIAASEFHHNSQELTDGLQGINQQLQQQSSDFKSQVKSALAALAIPSKAG